jgi:hypothetical protein
MAASAAPPEAIHGCPFCGSYCSTTTEQVDQMTDVEAGGRSVMTMELDAEGRWRILNYWDG